MSISRDRKAKSPARGGRSGARRAADRTAPVGKSATGSPTKAATKRAGAAKRPGTAAVPYHHGALRAALLHAAERILERDGIAGLTLRAAAREAGVSHAAPKNHFDDLKALLSELAAVGFDRLRAAMRANLRDHDPPQAQMAVIGIGYVTFARTSPGLFLLMFRGERLDFGRPALRTAADAAFGVLSGTLHSGAQGDATKLALGEGARIVGAWSQVHGLAMLLIDGRLNRLMARLPAPADEAALIAAVLGGGRASSSPRSKPALE